MHWGYRTGSCIDTDRTQSFVYVRQELYQLNYPSAASGQGLLCSSSTYGGCPSLPSPLKSRLPSELCLRNLDEEEFLFKAQQDYKLKVVSDVMQFLSHPHYRALQAFLKPHTEL